jgi:hypothetical protein
MLNFPNIPMCQIIGGLKILPIFDILIKEMEMFAKEFMGMCTRKGPMKAMNVSYLTSALIPKFPSGEYQINVQLFDAFDSNIFNATVDSMLTNQLT